MKENKRFTIKETAKRFGVSTRTIYKYIEENKINSIKNDGKIFIEEGTYKPLSKYVDKKLIIAVKYVDELSDYNKDTYKLINTNYDVLLNYLLQTKYIKISNKNDKISFLKKADDLIGKVVDSNLFKLIEKTLPTILQFMILLKN